MFRVRDRQRKRTGTYFYRCPFQTHITWQRLLTQTFSAILFGTGLTTARYIQVATYPWVDDPALSGAEYIWADDIDLRRWFPRGMYSVREMYIPGTSFVLRNAFRIFASLDTVSSVNNRAIAKRLDQFWLGNVIVMTHGRRVPRSIVNTKVSDLSLIEAVLSQ